MRRASDYALWITAAIVALVATWSILTAPRDDGTIRVGHMLVAGHE